MKNLIIPSIIAKDQNELDKRIGKVKKNFSWLQLDVMDGKLVKNSSLNFDFVLPKIRREYEAHLMIRSPEFWIRKNARKVDTIIFHFESVKKLGDARKIVNLIRAKKKRVGVAISPRTDVETIRSLLEIVDMVLVMTVNPGSYGAKFLPSMLDKIEEIKKINSKLVIEVDGGISDKTIHKAKGAGANYFVVGSYLQNSRNVSRSKKRLNLLIEGGEK